MQNKNYSGRQLGPRWAAQMSSQLSYMHANIKISVGPNWAPDGLAQMGSPLGTHLKTVAKVNWAPSGLPTWGPSDSPSGPHLWPSCTCWLGHSIISKYPGLRCNFNADDTQTYLSFSSELASLAFSVIESCNKDVCSWMIGNKLSVNPNKTEYFLFNSKTSMFLLALILFCFSLRVCKKPQYNFSV